MNTTVYLVMKKPACDKISLFRKILNIFKDINKEDIFVGFTTNKLLAETYLFVHNKDDFYIKEIVKNDDEYKFFSLDNRLNKIKRFKFENDEDILIMTEKEQMQYWAEGIKFYDSFE